MPTPPPERTFSTESHKARQIAEGFGGDAERFERTRPGYPDALADAVLAASSGRDVLDVGIGTGISARPFSRRGCRVLGVEPDERMAALARQSGLEVEVSTFEAWDPAGRRFDLVIAGQAWHWVDPVAGAAKAAHLLRPGGRLALFWNVMSLPPAFADACAAVYRSVVPAFPFFRDGAAVSAGASSYAALLDQAVSGIVRSGLFGEAERWLFDWVRTYTRDEWLDTVPTFGGHSQVPPETLNALLGGIGDVITAAGGSVRVDYAAVVVTAARTESDRQPAVG